jgi:iron(III) transport system permease protein
VARWAPLAVVVVAFPGGTVQCPPPRPAVPHAPRAAYAGHALPGVVVGLSLVFFGVGVARPIYQELPLLVLAYVVIFLSLALGSLQNAIAQIPRARRRGAVARTHRRRRRGGRSPLRLAAPGWAPRQRWCSSPIMKELPATLFLRPTGFDTLATQLWGHTSSFSKAAAAPYAVAIVVLAALPTALLSSLGGRRSATSPPTDGTDQR